jgi:hypothetical protein
VKPEIVIAVYRPHEGEEARLLDLVRGHVALLREEGLVTDRVPTIMRSRGGEVLEVFEWVGASAAHRAHENPAVAKTWNAMEAVADFVTLGSLAEATARFPHFQPL